MALVAIPVEAKAQSIAVQPVGVQLTPLTQAYDDTVAVHSLTPSDTFLGPDKVKHFFISAFIESLAFGGLEYLGASRGASIGGATAITAAAGIGREVHDRITKNLFSFGDLTWDAIGTVAALAMISHAQR